MQSLTIYQLRNLAGEHAAAVAATPDIDRFCSSLDWTLPAHEAFIPDHPLYLRQSEHGFVALARGFNPRIGRYLQPLEASWCLASPFVGTDAPRVIDEFAIECRSSVHDWDLLYLSGIPQTADANLPHPMFRQIVDSFGLRHRVGLGHRTKRFVASLDGGMDGFLARRSAKFRTNLRRSLRQCQEAGVRFEHVDHLDVDETAALYERILRVEERSWKGRAGTGILDGGMNDFYRIMLPRLARRDGLRVTFASIDDRDVAFVFGGVFGDTYRGLQLSYDEDFAQLSLGNAVQRQMIEALCREGVLRYDLGSELEYKARWAEERHETVTLWVWRS